MYHFYKTLVISIICCKCNIKEEESIKILKALRLTKNI